MGRVFVPFTSIRESAGAKSVLEQAAGPPAEICSHTTALRNDAHRPQSANRFSQPIDGTIAFASTPTVAVVIKTAFAAESPPIRRPTPTHLSIHHPRPFTLYDSYSAAAAVVFVSQVLFVTKITTKLLAPRLDPIAGINNRRKSPAA